MVLPDYRVRADELLDQTVTLTHWPDKVLTMQRRLDRAVGRRARQVPTRASESGRRIFDC